jgi:cell wall-associated NlpC family hydrolase
VTPPDPRRHAWRPDLAALPLVGRVPSLRFTAGTPAQVGPGVVSLKRAPAEAAEQVSQLLHGEAVTVYDQTDGWAWVQNQTDGYVGYLPAAALTAAVTAPSHRVSALRSFLYPRPDLRAPPLDILSFGSPVTVIGAENGYAAVAGGGWLFAGHLTPWSAVAADWVATASRFIGVPYLWGGRSSLGVDCSALVQLALAAAGISAPRDSDMQRAELGTAIDLDGAWQGRRGDLVFFPGHVGLMIDDQRLVHATAFVMAVTTEPLAAVIARTDPTRGGGLLAVRRLESP